MIGPAPSTSAAPSARSTRSWLDRSLWFLQNHGALVALLLLCVFAGTQDELFRRPDNLLNIARQVTPYGCIAIGMTFVIILGGIDLSVGALVAFVGGVSILALNRAVAGGASDLVAFAAGAFTCLVLAPLISLGAGTLIAKGRLAPFIATLGLMAALRSACLLLADGGEFRPAANPYFSTIGNQGLSLYSFTIDGQTVRVTLWYSVLAFVLLALSAHVLLRHTKFGRYVIAIGSNERAAAYSGISIDRVKILTYTFLGATCGLAALIVSSRLNSVSSSQTGTLYELEAIAAVVIGGTLMSGGRGSIYGTVVGVLLLGVVNNILNLYGVPPYSHGLVKGAIIIAAVLIQRGNRAQ